MQIDGYRVLRIAHEGSYGPVLQAEEAQTGKWVAIQVFTRQQPSTQAPVRGLQAYLQTLQRLSLPGVAMPMGCGTLPDGRLYLASAWIAGSTFPTTQQSLADALLWGQQLAATLESAHRHGLYHRHLRPSQILRSVGRHSRQSTVLGLGLSYVLGPPALPSDSAAKAFVAPEGHQEEGGAAADVYSLGVLIRMMLGLPSQPSRTASARAVGEAGAKHSTLTQLATLTEEMTSDNPALRPAMSEVNQQLFRLGKSRLLGFSRTVLGGDSTASVRNPGAPPTWGDTASDDAESTVAANPKPAAGKEGTDKDALLGQVFGNFRLVRCLGSGAMGTVYEARQELIGHRVAVKVLRPQPGAGKEYARRFIDEARAVNIVQHSGLVSVTDCGQRDDGLLFIVMELLSGETLETALERRTAPPPQAEALPILVQIARALAATHAHGIVHRDLKPSNIMLTRDAEAPDQLKVKILDFGIAKVASTTEEEGEHTQTGVIMGTPSYMAPEQYGAAKNVDGKADVFALGVLIFEMLAGQSPFGEGSSYVAVVSPPKRLREKVRSVSASLDVLVAQMLSPKPADRPSMQDVASALARLQGQRTLLWRAGALLVWAGLAGASAFVLLQPPSLAQLQQRQEDVRGRAIRVLQDALAPKHQAVVRVAAAQALGQTRDPAYMEWLIPLAKDADLEVALAATNALAVMGDNRSGAVLRELLDASSEGLRMEAALALTQLQPAKLGEPGRSYLRQQLARLIKHAPAQTAPLRARLAGQLCATGDKLVCEQLLDGLEQQDASIPFAFRLSYLEQLAGRVDLGARARQQLLLMAAQRDDSQRLLVIASLQRLGLADDAARLQLLQTAQKVGPQQTIAAWHLSRLGSDGFCPLFVALVRDTAQDVHARQLAADGLARCGFEKVQVLVPLLEKLEGTQDPALSVLRVHYAGSLLRAVGPKPARSAEQQWKLVESLVSSDRSADYLTAVAMLEALPDERSVELLGQVLANSQADVEVRKAAAAALGTKQLRGVLGVLAVALQDANTDVRESGMRAILRLMAELKHPESAGLGSALLDRLHQLMQSADNERERVVARLLLLRSGERDQLDPLRRLMNQSDREELRLLIVELAPAESELVRSALHDSSVKVRFFAARRRAEVQGRDAIPVLQEMLARRGEEALLSYWMLRRLDVSVSAPAHLGDLLGRGAELFLRIEVVRILAQLSVAEALPLLQQAQTDPAAMVRREVALAASALYGRSHDPRLLDMLHSLLGDAESTVRIKAQALLNQLQAGAVAQQAKPTLSSEALKPQSQPVIAKPAVAQQPIAVDAGVDALAQTESSLVVRPRIKEPVAPAANRMPPTPSQQGHAWLSDAGKLLGQGKKDEAVQVLDSALKQLKNDSSLDIYSRLRWERGEVQVSRGRLDDALRDYNMVWDRYHGSPPSPMVGIDRKFEALKQKVGRLDIYIKKQSECVRDSSLLVMGGMPLAFTYKGRIRVEAKIPAGQVQKQGECLPAGKK